MYDGLKTNQLYQLPIALSITNPASICHKEGKNRCISTVERLGTGAATFGC